MVRVLGEELGRRKGGNRAKGSEGREGGEEDKEGESGGGREERAPLDYLPWLSDMSSVTKLRHGGRI